MVLHAIPTRIHGVIDYIYGLAAIGVAAMAGFASPGAMWVLAGFGVFTLASSLMTDYEAGALRVVPMSAHLVFDLVGGALVLASPWLFGFAGETWVIHVVFGAFSVVAALMTDPRPRGAAHRSFAHA